MQEEKKMKKKELLWTNDQKTPLNRIRPKPLEINGLSQLSNCFIVILDNSEEEKDNKSEKSQKSEKSLNLFELLSPIKLRKRSEIEKEANEAAELDYLFKKGEETDFKGLINPDGTFKTIWEILHSILIIYIALILSFKMSFVSEDDYPFWNDFDLIINLFLAVDMILTFFTPYLDSNYTFITQKKKIAINYLLSFWFYLDLLAIFPFSFFFSHSSKANIPLYLRLIRAPSFYRVIKIFRLFVTLRKKNSNFVSKLINFFKKRTENIFVKNLPFFLLVFVMAHIFACVWHYFNSSNPNNWIFSANYAGEPTIDRYFSSLYFIYTTLTTVGYGDLTPVTILEKTMALGLMSLGVIIFAYVFQKMLDEMTEIAVQSNEISNKLFELKILQKQLELKRPIILEMRRIIMTINTQIQYYKRLTTKPPVLKDLDVQGYDKLLIEAFTSYFSKFSLFKDFSNEMKIKFFLKHDVTHYPKNSFIYKENFSADSIYFIRSGSVDLCYSVDILGRNRYLEFVKLKSGCIFGAFEALVNPKKSRDIKQEFREDKLNGLGWKINHHYFHSAFVSRDVICYQIDREDLTEIMEIDRSTKRKLIAELCKKGRTLEFWRSSLENLSKDFIKEERTKMALNFLNSKQYGLSNNQSQGDHDLDKSAKGPEDELFSSNVNNSTNDVNRFNLFGIDNQDNPRRQRFDIFDNNRDDESKNNQDKRKSSRDLSINSGGSFIKNFMNQVLKKKNPIKKNSRRQRRLMNKKKRSGSLFVGMSGTTFGDKNRQDNSLNILGKSKKGLKQASNLSELDRPAVKEENKESDSSFDFGIQSPDNINPRNEIKKKTGKEKRKMRIRRKKLNKTKLAFLNNQS